MTTTNVNRRILKALQNGGDFTANQLRNRFGISNVSARISDLRKAGYPVYLNTKTTDNGRTIRTYRLGTATRADVVASSVVKDILSNPSRSYVFVDDLQNEINSRLATSF